ncbi:MAG: hypothetical protein WCJ64_12910 [Rhodospirillaceae bacterium]
MRYLAVVIFSLALVIPAMTSATAEEKKAEAGGTTKHTLMVPVMKKGTQAVQKIIPIIIEVHSETDAAKNFLDERMPILQDGYLQATYGKITTDTTYDEITHLVSNVVMALAPDDLRDSYHFLIRANVKPQ